MNAPHSRDEACCIALSDAHGHPVAGSRLTHNLPLSQALDALPRIRIQFPAAGIFQSRAVDSADHQPKEHHDEHDRLRT